MIFPEYIPSTPLTSSFKISWRKTHHCLIPTSCPLSNCSQTAEQGWGRTYNHSLWSQVGPQPARESLHISSVKSLPCHQDNHFTHSSNIKLNPNLLICNCSQRKSKPSQENFIFKLQNLPTYLHLYPCTFPGPLSLSRSTGLLLPRSFGLSFDFHISIFKKINQKNKKDLSLPCPSSDTAASL